MTLYQELFDYAAQQAPMEMCGLLFAGDRFIRCENIATDKEHTFEIDHQAYLKACMIQDEKPWAIVHSHPRSGAAPSVKDCRLMDACQVSGHDLSMVMVGLKPKEIRCFKKRGELYKLEWVWLK